MKTYRVFPDYSATGVWGEQFDDPYVIEYPDLLEMGASTETIYLLKKMQFVYTNGDCDELEPEEETYINWAARTAAARLTKETGFSFRSLDI